MKINARTSFAAVLPLLFLLVSVSAQEEERQSASLSVRPVKAEVKTETETKPGAEKKAVNPSNPSKDKEKSKNDEKSKTSEKPVESKKEFSEAIADNSFLIEEAYNQEPGVMQTISTCNWYRRPQSDVACTVTQEFPVGSQKHQFSYTAPFSFLDSGRVKGSGDLAFNYRYQLTGENDWAAVSPRISLLLPTGSFRRGLGSGATGVQFNLPVSKRLSNSFVAHFNAGATFLGKAKSYDEDGNLVKRNLSNYNLGGSVIWLAQKRFNLVFEYVENFASEINESGRVQRFNEHIVNPGARFAIDIGPLQVVPGISVPTSIVGGERRTGVFFYLSFEHPFKKLR